MSFDKIIKLAHNTLEIEINAINALKKSINKDFEAAVKKMFY